MKKVMVFSAVLSLLAAPALAFAGPSVGISYTDMNLAGHSGRPGVGLNAGDVLNNKVVIDGSASVARSYYNIDASIGKFIPIFGGEASVAPYFAAGFLHLKYNTETGYTRLQDVYGLVGANLDIPLSRRVAFGMGGGYGHTFGTYENGIGGAVYTGDAILSFQIAPHVSTDVAFQYLHVPGAAMQDYNVGLNYHF